MKLALFLGTLLSLVSLSGAAQNQPAAEPTFTTRTDLVLVPVVVTDKQGRAVLNLKKEDFEVEESGKTEKIAVFEEVSAKPQPLRRPPPPRPNTFTNDVESDQAARALTIIAIDAVNTEFHDQASARRELIKWLSQTVPQSSGLMALVAIHQNGVRLIHDFTSDPAILIAAVQKLNGTIAPVNSNIDPSRATASSSVSDSASAVEAATEANRLATILEGNGDPNSAKKAQMEAVRFGAEADIAQSRQNQAALVTMESFQFLAQYFSAVPGRKTLLWVTHSFPFTLNNGIATAVPGVTPEMFQRTMQMLNNANISVYPIDAAGIVANVAPARMQAPTVLNSSAEGIRQRSAQLNNLDYANPSANDEARLNTMRSIADMTGGLAMHNSNDIARLFGQAAADSQNYYLLGYYPSDTTKLGWRKLKVHTQAQGAQLRYRSGFFYTKASQDPEASRHIDEAVALDSPLDYTTLPLLAAWQNTDKDGSKRKVHFMLLVPPEAITIDSAKNNHVSLDFLAVAKDSDGQPVGQPLTQNFQKDLPATEAKVFQTQGMKYVNAISVPPGDYTVRFVVRDNVSGKMGSVLAPVKVE